MKALRLQVTSTKDLLTEAVQIGFDYNITAYDGCYVALSQQVSAPLLTLDERLVNSLAATSFDVQLFTNFLVPPFLIQ